MSVSSPPPAATTVSSSATSKSAAITSATRGPGSALIDADDATIPPLDSFPETGTPDYPKLASWDLYAALNSPKRIVAPMVDQSELAWRILSRRYGSDLVYTPMINAGMFVNAIKASSSKGKGKGRRFLDEHFDVGSGEEGAELIRLLGKEHEGKRDTDAPLIVQFCANNPDTLLQAAQYVENNCSAIDLNLGCPQGIARRGHYGAFLMEDWPLIFSLVNKLHLHSRAPVTAKMRIYPSLARTIAYARMLERAGAQFLTVHGRTREMKGHHTGLADWEAIRAVKKAVAIPVFANGNVQYPADVDLALRRTGADGIMSAEGNLFNPAIFLPPSSPLLQRPSTMFPHAPEFPFPAIIPLAHEYLDIVRGLKTQTGISAIKAHLFRICKPALNRHHDLRQVLGRSHTRQPEVEAASEAASTSDSTKAQDQDQDRLDAAELERREARLVEYRSFVNALAAKLEVDQRGGLDAFRAEIEAEKATLAAGAEVQLAPPARKVVPEAIHSPYYDASLEAGAEEKTVDGLVVLDSGAVPADVVPNAPAYDQRPDRIPHWLAQPYFRPELPPEHYQKVQEQNALQAAEKAARRKALKSTSWDGGGDDDDEQEGGRGREEEQADADAATAAGSELPAAKRLRESIVEASALKDEGNTHFVAKRTAEALSCYEDAVAVLPPQPSRDSRTVEGGDEEDDDAAAGGKGEEEEEIISSAGVVADENADLAEAGRLRAVLYANIAACHLASDHYDLAIRATTSALVDDPAYVKALYRRATAYEKKGGWVSLSNAEEDLKKILTIPETPASLRPTVQASLQRLKPLVEEAGKKEKDEMMGQLKGLGNTVLGYFGLSTDNFKFEQQANGGYSMNFVK
ncbi:hypothetical protein V8E36_004202 [Tilletia maclaganii]